MPVSRKCSTTCLYILRYKWLNTYIPKQPFCVQSAEAIEKHVEASPCRVLFLLPIRVTQPQKLPFLYSPRSTERALLLRPSVPSKPKGDVLNLSGGCAQSVTRLPSSAAPPPALCLQMRPSARNRCFSQTPRFAVAGAGARVAPTFPDPSVGVCALFLCCPIRPQGFLLSFS